MFVIAFFLFLPLAVFSQEDLSREQIIDLIKQLDSDDWRIREKATQELIEIGADAVEILEKYKESPSLEVKVRIEHILEQINKTHFYKGIGLEIKISERESPPLDVDNTIIYQDSEYTFKVYLRNKTNHKIILYKNGFDVSIEPNYVKRELPLGFGFSQIGLGGGAGGGRGYGGRRQRIRECLLKETDFLVLEPQKQILVKEDEERIKKIDTEEVLESFDLTITYSYNQQDYLKKCNLNCPGHNDPDKPWNNALSDKITKKLEKYPLPD